MTGRPILVIDNGTHYLDELQRALRLIAAPFRVLPGDSPLPDRALAGAAGIILTGGEVHVYEPDQLIEVRLSSDLIMQASLPILGLCLGCQLVAVAFGGTVASLPAAVDRPVDIEWLAADPLREGLPPRGPMVMAHNDAVTDTGPQVITLARSAYGAHEAIRHRSRPVYGLQFHPEVSGDRGRRLLANFAAICRTPVPAE